MKRVVVPRGNPAANTAAQIQRALDNGGDIYISSGDSEIFIDRTLYISSNTKLIIENDLIITANVGTGTMLGNTLLYDYSLVSCTASTFASVKNITITSAGHSVKLNDWICLEGATLTNYNNVYNVFEVTFRTFRQQFYPLQPLIHALLLEAKVIPQGNFTT